MSELDAAGIVDPRVRAAYARARELNAEHGKTYFLATRLLPAARRPAIHALYGFARWADEIVDDLTDTRPWSVRGAELDTLESELRAGLAGAPVHEPVLVALVDTITRHRLEPELFWDFLAAMRRDAVGSDTETTSYASWAHLMEYVHGSAAVIGLQVVPVLGTVVPREEAAPRAAELGIAFQLTNFLRDVGEDLDRGRVYLPADELAAFGVDRERLEHARTHGGTDRHVRAALAHLVARNRAIYRAAEPGIAMLEPASRPCVRAAFTLYGDILGEIEDAGFAVLSRRVVVGRRRRVAVAAPLLGRAVTARVLRR